MRGILRLKAIASALVSMSVLAAFVQAAHAVNYVASAYDSRSNRYLTVYLPISANSPLSLRFVDAEGNALGDVTTVKSGGTYLNPVAAYDTILDRFLVVWSEYNNSTGQFDVKGRILASGGTFLGDEFVLGANTENQSGAKIAFSPSSGRYLVVFPQGTITSIAGQFVNGDGTLHGGNFTALPGDNYTSSPDIAYDGVNHRFLVAALTYGGSAPPMKVAGAILDDNGAVVVPAFPIIDASNFFYLPAIAFDPASQRYLVVYGVYPSSFWGQLVAADGKLVGEHLVISDAASNDADDVVYNDGTGRFLAAWAGGGVTAREIASDGTNYGAAFTPAASYHQYAVSLAFNAELKNTLLTYKSLSSEEASWTVIGAPQLPALYDVAGRVVDASGAPMANVRVRLQAALEPAVTVRTNAKGRFFFADVPPGKYVLRPVKTGVAFFPGKRTEVVGSQNVLKRNFRALP